MTGGWGEGAPLRRAAPAAGAPRPSPRRWAQPALPRAPGAVCGRCVAIATAAGLRRSSPRRPSGLGGGGTGLAVAPGGQRPSGGRLWGRPGAAAAGAGEGACGGRAGGPGLRVFSAASCPAPAPEPPLGPASCGGEGGARRGRWRWGHFHIRDASNLRCSACCCLTRSLTCWNWLEGFFKLFFFSDKQWTAIRPRIPPCLGTWEKKWRRSGVPDSSSSGKDGLEVGERRAGRSLISCPLRQAQRPDLLAHVPNSSLPSA